MTDFIIGCTHFGHANIIKLANRPFQTLEEMDETMIDRWNMQVNKNDTVYHLGDFSYKANAQKYESKLNGRMIKIRGNHDPDNWGQNYLSFKLNKSKVVLFHYPIEEWDGWWRPGSVHFHCHTHKKEFKSAERRGNVGADAIGFTPMKLNIAIEKLLT